MQIHPVSVFSKLSRLTLISDRELLIDSNASVMRVNVSSSFMLRLLSSLSPVPIDLADILLYILYSPFLSPLLFLNYLLGTGDIMVEYIDFIGLRSVPCMSPGSAPRL